MLGFFSVQCLVSLVSGMSRVHCPMNDVSSVKFKGPITNNLNTWSVQCTVSGVSWLGQCNMFGVYSTVPIVYNTVSGVSNAGSIW